MSFAVGVDSNDYACKLYKSFTTVSKTYTKRLRVNDGMQFLLFLNKTIIIEQYKQKF